MAPLPAAASGGATREIALMGPLKAGEQGPEKQYRIRLTEPERLRLVEALKALIPPDVLEQATDLEWRWGNLTKAWRQWNPYIALLARLEECRPGGSSVDHRDARHADRYDAKK